MLRLLLAWLHLIALGIGLAAVFTRARALASPLDERRVTRALGADAAWGLAAVLWISTGLWRLFAGTEKAPTYYMRNDAFLAKLALFAVILLLELWPMLTLIRWRAQRSKGAFVLEPQGTVARRIATISYIQFLLVAIMVLLANAMARGYGS